MSLPALEVPTLDDMVALLEGQLPSGFPINDTDPFGVWNTFKRLAAEAGIDARAYLAGVVPQGFILTATGPWLDAHAQSQGLRRIQSSFTEGNVTFSLSAPGTVPAGAIVATPPDVNGEELRYRVIQDTPGNPPSVLVPVRAESPGSRYNAASGRISRLLTVLPFVSGVGNAEGWISEAGVDPESDDELRERILLSWPAQSYAGIDDNYVFWARQVPGIVKVRVLEHPRGQGTVDVLIAPRSGLPTAQQIADVQAIINRYRPYTADPLVRAPGTQAVGMDLTVYTREGKGAAYWQGLALEVYQEQGIGEVFYPSSVLERLHADPLVRGAVAASMTPVTPAGDTLVVAGAINVSEVIG